ncbi:asparagine synthase (glutamine-hydrolyzing) [Aquabacterium sp.]|uniref:asparagine synthase (glutamine-hydrolyzing) n=1 Tax=Aquabacterium sp. TaxID=1872578 RepID=UPI00248A2E31|nr:asparagine synthase (glutamine-hydrolyzing) [Aquabacterium sp.]MDI1259396.1 asparagine synthase (glutamine-hydrolyzing) [Aquabacterium sp.]
MCGISGFISPGNFHETEMSDICRQMTALIRHRGPDSDGIWLAPHSGVALGHARLSIQDLSPSGHQPMASQCGRFVITFNGEIYNHLDIRVGLRHREMAWVGHSDTETLVEAISALGMEQTLQQCIGMFAFCVWDREQNTLTLARDRFGEKPLYYGMCGDSFLFSSELTSLRGHPHFASRISRTALSDYFKRGYVPAPQSIYEGIYKLPPGCCLTYKPADRVLGTPYRYWTIAQASHGQDEEGATAIETIDARLRSAVQRQLIGDVPLGAFLSGGIDSTLVVALMQSLSPNPVNTFTIGFAQSKYNEANQAKRIATYLGTHHTELYINESELLSTIPRIADVYDEPFADASQVPTVLLCQLAKQHVTVALTGDGADELFGGYRRYTDGPLLWSLARRLPLSARRCVSRLLESLPPGALNAMPARISDLAEKLQKVAQLLSANSQASLYSQLTTHQTGRESIVIGGYASPDPEPGMIMDSIAQNLMLLDIDCYLPDDILVKVDRAAMSVGLETRAPFLDHLVAESAWRLPLTDKIQGRRGKMILRQVMSKYVPEALIATSKKGFTPPVGEWLKGPLKAWAADLLDSDLLRRQGFLVPELVQRRWQEHQAGKRNWTYQLWDVLMFQSWLAQHERQAGTQTSRTTHPTLGKQPSAA